MELVLEGATDIPEGSLLSFKIGEFTRQGVASKLGSVVRFGCLPAGPLNATVELLAPAAPRQPLALGAGAGRSAVDFGGGRHVALRARRLAQRQRAKVDLNKIVGSRKLPSEKLQEAQRAARYLEEHDIVHTFQEILHCLLLERPDDPFAFIDEHLATARALSTECEDRCEEEQRCAETAKAFIKDVVATAAARCSNAPASMEAPKTSQHSRDNFLLRVQAADGTSMDAGRPQGGGAREGRAPPPDAAVDCPPSPLGNSGQLSSALGTARSEASLFDGCWMEGAEVHNICGTEIRWANGVCTEIELTGAESFSVVLYGKVYSASLEDEGRVLRWCDGDLWQRAEGAPGDCQPVKVNKVEALLGSMHSLKRSLPMVLPALPQQLRDQLVDPELAEECKQRFGELDQSHNGKLSPEDLQPVVAGMSAARRHSITPEQCQRFAHIFDVNQDGMIEQSEFAGLMRFALIAGFLESDEGEEAASLVLEEDRLFRDFLRTLEQDFSLMDQVVPLLPRWMRAHLESEQFKEEWMEHFDRLDKDKNEVLDPVELLPEVLRLSEVHPLTIDIHKCRQFTAVFDRRKDGVIRRDEWLDLAKCLSVMCYLAGEEEQSAQAQQWSAGRVQELLRMLEEDRNRLSEVIPFLPEELKIDIMSDSFVAVCVDTCRRLDQNGQGELDPQDMFPLVMGLCEARDFPIRHEECQHFAALFCKGSGAIGPDEAVDFARFAIVLAFLGACGAQGRAPSSATEEASGEPRPPPRPGASGLEAAEQLLRSLEADAAKLGEIVAFLPMQVKAPLLSPSFAEECLAEFGGLDGGARGALAPERLLPAVVRLGRSRQFAVSQEQCFQFLELLSSEHNSLIQRGEFASFVQFLLALAYFATEEGKVAAAAAQRALGRRRVEELLAMLERDRCSIRKVVPLLPHALVEHLASADFAKTSNSRFTELDTGGHGRLSPSDLVPLVVELSLAQPSAVGVVDCRRLAAIFGGRGDGAMREEEFLEMSRFLCIMSFLHTEDGQKTLEMAGEPQHGCTVAPPADNLGVALFTRRICADLEHYRTQAARLERDNERQREHILRMEAALRRHGEVPAG